MVGLEPADPFEGLNPEQRAAVESDPARPLLILAGAGTGKTHTLAHRLAWLVVQGLDPRRILLLTFTRRAAAELDRRAQRIVARVSGGPRAAEIAWAGTFHAVGNRILRRFAESVGLDPSFTVLDRGDAADLLDVLRTRLGFTKLGKRFPQKSTCLAIYSRCVNTRRSLEAELAAVFPWCREWEGRLRELFAAYVEAKQARHVLDYDDLLLYWSHLMAEPALAREVAAGFDHVLVDEYQDTNALQEAILMGLRPEGSGLTVVGDDAQAIFGFRAATVENILGFPDRFPRAATVVKLEANYRSTQPILEAANAVIGLSTRAFEKRLRSVVEGGTKPSLVTAEDETAQVECVVERILEAREQGIALKQQAVLFRTAHHSAELEIELGRRGIPFVKFGGLKFLEAAHVKDLLSVLRFAENPRDGIAGYRVAKLLPGIGPAAAERIVGAVEAAGGDLGALAGCGVPPGARPWWPGLVELLVGLRGSPEWQGQVGRVRSWYQPHLERIHDDHGVRAGDLEQLETIAARFPSRERFLVELTLDPPEATGAESGVPYRDEDYLILSTIHSAKGQEWEAVYLLNLADGAIPSDLATGTPEEVEEERRLLYVAMTRARRNLTLVHPHRFQIRGQARLGDRHVYAPVSRFVPPAIRDRFEAVGFGRTVAADGNRAATSLPRIDVASRLRAMWERDSG